MTVVISEIRSFLTENLVFLQATASSISIATTLLCWLSINSKLKRLHRGKVKIGIEIEIRTLVKESQQFLNVSSSIAAESDNFQREFSKQSAVLRDSLRRIEEALDDKDFKTSCRSIRKNLEKFAHIPIKKMILLFIPYKEFSAKELNHLGFNIVNDTTNLVNQIQIRISHSKQGIPDV